MLSSIRSIRSMTNITSKINTEISTNGTRLGSKRLGLSKHLTSLFDNILSLPAHAHDRSRRKEVDKTGEEGLLGKISIVGSSHFLGGPDHFESYEFVSTLLETGNDISYDCTLDSIGLYGEEGTFLVGSWDSEDGEGVALCSGLVGGEKCGSCSSGCKGKCSLCVKRCSSSTSSYGLKLSINSKGRREERKLGLLRHLCFVFVCTTIHIFLMILSLVETQHSLGLLYHFLQKDLQKLRGSW